MTSPKIVHIQYFAALREQCGRSDETLETTSQTAGDLFEQLRQKHKISLPPESLRVAINDEFSPWETEIKSNDTIVFIPPVSGG